MNRSVIDGSALDPPSPPQIMPSYYGGLVVNSLIGSSGNAQIIELTVNDTNVSGYAAFEQGELVRAVFVNLHAWLKSSSGDRPSVHLGLDLNGTSSRVAAFTSRSVVARRLILQHADDTSNLTWAGQSYETAEAQPEGGVVEVHVALDTGLNLRASEAVLVDFNQMITPVSATSTSSSRNKGKYIAAGVVSGAAVAFIGAGGIYYARRRMTGKQQPSPSTSGAHFASYITEQTLTSSITSRDLGRRHPGEVMTFCCSVYSACVGCSRGQPFAQNSRRPHGCAWECTTIDGTTITLAILE